MTYMTNPKIPYEEVNSCVNDKYAEIYFNSKLNIKYLVSFGWLTFNKRYDIFILGILKMENKKNES